MLLTFFYTHQPEVFVSTTLLWSNNVTFDSMDVTFQVRARAGTRAMETTGTRAMVTKAMATVAMAITETMTTNPLATTVMVPDTITVRTHSILLFGCMGPSVSCFHEKFSFNE